MAKFSNNKKAQELVLRCLKRKRRPANFTQDLKPALGKYAPQLGFAIWNLVNRGDVKVVRRGMYTAA